MFREWRSDLGADGRKFCSGAVSLKLHENVSRLIVRFGQDFVPGTKYTKAFPPLQRPGGVDPSLVVAGRLVRPRPRRHLSLEHSLFHGTFTQDLQRRLA